MRHDIAAFHFKLAFKDIGVRLVADGDEDAAADLVEALADAAQPRRDALGGAGDEGLGDDVRAAGVREQAGVLVDVDEVKLR